MAQLPQAEIEAALDGARVLVVEDDFLIRIDLEATLTEAGAAITGLCATVQQALEAISVELPDAAILDVRLGTETVGPVARELTRLGIPFVFYTGQVGADATLDEWPQHKVLPKPSQPKTIVTAVANLLKS
jgi:DNA-binding NtrC family response regulator